ncbi:hypothetical protein L9F63_000490, partial [Diploptera punctata]
ETKLLNNGLKTCINFSNNVEDYVADVEIAISELKNEDKTIIRKECEKVLVDMKSNSKNKVTLKNMKILKGIKDRNVTIAKADKGNKIVILDQEDYVDRMNHLLDSKEYEEIKSNPLPKTIRTVGNTLKHIKHTMKEQEKFKLKVSNPSNPKLYGLPKPIYLWDDIIAVIDKKYIQDALKLLNLQDEAYLRCCHILSLHRILITEAFAKFYWLKSPTYLEGFLNSICPLAGLVLSSTTIDELLSPTFSGLFTCRLRDDGDLHCIALPFLGPRANITYER